ncbi:MAG: WYL domain-containing protein [Clostridia bacterium]|nr:WYL domain-containing protein [Clostridia bacterium]
MTEKRAHCNEGDKKIALIRMIQILENETDQEHPLTQQEILDKLNDEFGLVVNDRKFVGRNLRLLRELFESDPFFQNPACAINLETDKRRGSYFSKRLFENSELKVLIDAVLSSKYIPEKHSKDLIEKLCMLSNRYFKSHVKYISVPNRNKTENRQLFLNIDLIDEAIEKGKQIVFDYNKYGADKKLHKTVSHKESPYRLILHNQRYYLMYGSEKYKTVGFLRVDKITNIEVASEPLTPLAKLTGYKSGYDYKNIVSTLPYMFGDEIKMVTFLASDFVVDDIVDYFGNDAQIKELPEHKLEVTVHTSPKAMEYWAMQYLNYVEIKSPDSLRERIKENLEAAREKYR